MDEYEYDALNELKHEEEAVLALGLALDEALEYIRDLLDMLYQIHPRAILRHTPDVMQAESFYSEWTGSDDR